MLSRLLRSAALIAAAPFVAADHPVSPDTGFDVVAYEVALTPDIGAKSVRGTETIRLRVRRPGLATLSFSPNALAIGGATLDGRPVHVSADAEAVVFTPAVVLRRGQTVILSFSFQGTPRRGIESVPGGLYSSYFACDWMICLQDSPGDKARFSLDLTVPAGLTSLASGTLTGSVVKSDGTTVERWRTKRDYAPYLFSFAVGPFRRAASVRGNSELTYLDATGLPHDLAAMFAGTPAMIAFLSAKAGAPLPAGRYAQLLVPGYEAQEAATFSLIGLDALERDLSAPESEWILIHELAHQWWGNLVSCATWRDFWLNEGLATFMTAAWKEHRYGKAAYDAELDGARRRLAAARERGFDKPLAWDGDYPSIGTRRAVQYSKGALFLDHLRQVMGDKAFWAGIKRFTQAHAGGTVASADFQKSMQQASHRDLRPDFREWVHAPR